MLEQKKNIKGKLITGSCENSIVASKEKPLLIYFVFFENFRQACFLGLKALISMLEKLTKQMFSLSFDKQK